MIYNKNYNDPEVTRKMNKEVGEPFSFRQRIMMKGIGSTKLLVREMSEDFKPYFGNNQDLKYISVELRPYGIIIYIKSKINDYAWCIPYYRLSLFQSNFFSFHGEGKFLKVDLKTVYPFNKRFIERLRSDKSKVDELRVV